MSKLKLFFGVIALIAILAGVNWLYQVINNPVILMAPFVEGKYKSSGSTWKAYRYLFKRHSTDIMTPGYLGALAQAESAGNPLITPEWKWRLTTNPFKIYAPASTSAGLYQYTKPTFQDAKRFCIHNNEVVLAGPVWDPTSCWFNGLYSRLWPSHAIEMTSARLHHYATRILKRKGLSNVSLENKQKLASIIHLCGVGKGRRFADARFRFSAVPKCGSHATSAYYYRIRRNLKQYEKSSKGLFW